ncbi:hypothetical protein SteCoe_7131 [Stentor coeruleus]|uniref:AMP-dependent synthetase/ligase domain-containing protein n=1 Tax=Stentor coeruleus TaxID=5963 RepID=A0A1R2CNM5_9CILI|nr:hypothetical protein SteCoe_7131 [Stentor coeruleus]
MDRKYLWIDPNSFAKTSSPEGKHLHWVTDLSDELPIVMGESNYSNTSPLTVPDLFTIALKTHANRGALRYKKEGKGQWIAWTYLQYYNDSKKFAASLIALNIKAFSTTNIIGFNSPQWVIGFNGTIFAGCIPVGTYTTNNVEACEYIAGHSEAQLILVQNEVQLKKYLKLWPSYPKIKAIVVYWPGKELESLRKNLPIYTWDEFMKMHSPKDLAEVDIRIGNIRPTQVATIVYTSGTTGPPKGVLLSHDNCTWTFKTIIDSSQLLGDDERTVSYLPLSHSAAQQLDIFAAIISKADVYFADEKALQGSLVNTMKEARPTFFFGVPRVFEKMEEKIRAIGANRSGWQKSVADWAKRVGFENSLNQVHGRPTTFSYSIVKRLVFDKIKEGLGLDQCKIIAVGAAPISKACLEYFLSLNVILMNVYGMSESSAPETLNILNKCNIYSAGCAIEGTDLVIKSPNGQILPRGEQGEICFRGRNKFMGYYKNDAATKETIDLEGFIHSGDKGYLDEKGFLYITGRYKELIITAGGENIPPILIEDAVKEKCSIISNAFLIGDARKYLSMLISFKSKPTADGNFTNELTLEVVEKLSQMGAKVTTTEEAASNQIVMKYIQGIIDYVNKQSTSRAQEIKKFKFIIQDFSIAGGELTPTLKVKRKVVLDKYKALIEKMYADPKL